MSDITIIYAPPGDIGFAAKLNGTILLRTASDTDHQAMGNALVLIYGCDPEQLNWADIASIKDAFAFFARNGFDDVEIVPVQAFERK